MNSRDRDVQRDVVGCRAAHASLLATIADLRDEAARSPSLLPGWTVGHVLTHLARNADGFSGMFAGAQRDEVVAQYPSPDARTADIDAGAERPAAELVEDVRNSVARLERWWDDLDEAAWARHGATFGGPVPMSVVPSRRWREVEVHHADLGLGWTSERWSEGFVRVELVHMSMLWASRRPMGLTALPAAALAAPPRRRLAWLFGRAEIDGLEPAGIY